MLGYRILWGKQIPLPRDSFVWIKFWTNNKNQSVGNKNFGHGSSLHYVLAMQIVYKGNEYSICIHFTSVFYCQTVIKGPLEILEEISENLKGKYSLFTLIFIRYEAQLNWHL